VEGAQTVRADIHLLLFALIGHCPLGDIWHKASVDGVHRVAARVTVQRTLAANIASLSHNDSLLFKIVALTETTKNIPQSFDFRKSLVCHCERVRFAQRKLREATLAPAVTQVQVSPNCRSGIA
jgi:hypothetical protein